MILDSFPGNYQLFTCLYFHFIPSNTKVALSPGTEAELKQHKAIYNAAVAIVMADFDWVYISYMLITGLS